MTNVDRTKLTEFIITQFAGCPDGFDGTEDTLRAKCDEANDVELDEMAERWKDEINFQDAKEIEIDNYVRELQLAREQTVTLTRQEWEDLSYACAHAEMMWRKRSHNPSIDSHGSYAYSPEEFEATCRAEMKKYRVLQRKVDEAIGHR
jgi:hypothetical protein